MKGYFGGKEILQVVLGGKTLYKKSSGVELPPPETITVRVADFLKAYLTFSKGNAVGDVVYLYSGRMTDWVKVRPNSSYKMETSRSSECTVQLKNSEGEITLATGLEGQRSVQGRVFNTGDNTYVRIYFYLGNYHESVGDLILTEQRN